MDIKTYLLIAFFTIAIGAMTFTSLPWFLTGDNDNLIAKVALGIIYGTWIIALIAISFALDEVKRM